MQTQEGRLRVVKFDSSTNGRNATKEQGLPITQLVRLSLNYMIKVCDSSASGDEINSVYSVYRFNMKC